jgi:homoserine dehydrogenase
MSRGKRTKDGVKLKVRAEVLDESDTFATIKGSSNLLLLHTDLMGTLGVMEVAPGIEQVAYGLLADVSDIARSI